MSQPVVEQSDIDSLFAQSKRSEHRLTSHMLVVCAEFPHAGGFVLSGINVCSPMREYDLDYARADAEAQIKGELWKLEAYRMACLLEQSLPAPAVNFECAVGGAGGGPAVESQH